MVSLLDAEESFWRSVEADTPPLDIVTSAAPAPDKMRDVDMTGSNKWASNAQGWRDNRKAAKTFADSEKALKELMEPDMGRGFGHGIEINRAKNGALRIKEMKEC